MTRTIRCLLHLAILAASALSGAAGAGSLVAANTALSSGLTFTPVPCAAVTPVVHSMSVSVPFVGSGRSCTLDSQCTGAGEYCGFSTTATSGTCQASGLLSRGNIHYVAGNTVDVDVTIPRCSRVSDVLMNGASTPPIGFDGALIPAGWSVVSSTATSVNGQAATRSRVRIQFPNAGDGLSTPMAIKVTATVGGASTSSPTFTVAGVDAVNAAMRNSVSETRIRNAFVTSLYEKFGDYDQVVEGGEVVAYHLDWDILPIPLPPGPNYFEASDIRIAPDSVMFGMHFQAPGCGDTEVYVAGWFDLVPAGDGFDLVWLEGPRAVGDSGPICNNLRALWELVADDLFDEQALADDIAKSVTEAFELDETGHLTVCQSCRMVDIQIGDGTIEILSRPPVPSVRLAVPTTRPTDRTADSSKGILLPSGTFVPISAGGTYESCQAADGRTPATCPKKYEVDMEGLFNWWGSDVPVPSPIAYDANGHGVTLGGRQNAWARLEGVVRDVTRLPDRTFPVGSLLARRSPPSLLTSTPRNRVSNGCVIAPIVGAPYKIAFGVNDIASSTPPTRGELEVTLLIHENASTSAQLFGSSARCEAGPVSSGSGTGLSR